MITVLCGENTHPVVGYIKAWIAKQELLGRSIRLVFKHEEVVPGGILFALSYGRILPPDFVKQFDHVIVLHASDLPKGRGWSPYVWDLLAGAEHITLSAISAAERVDEGDIWSKVKIDIKPTDVFREINNKLFCAEISLIENVLSKIERGEQPTPQDDAPATYYPRRTPEDSRVHLDNTLGEIFNLLRIADPERYPVFFEKDGVRYNLYLEKIDENV